MGATWNPFNECFSLLLLPSVVHVRAAPVSSGSGECSLVATLFEGQWSALPTNAHSRGDGSLTGQGTDSVVAESREQSVWWCRACTRPHLCSSET